MRIEYSELPGFRNLFLDYINDFESVEKFFKKNFRNNDDYLKTFAELDDFSAPLRAKIVEIIKNQYDAYRISKQTESNIASLLNEKTFTIVVSGQTKIFGGSMDTIYKATTVIKLTNLLNEKYNDYNFIPIFWMDADNHNFEDSSVIKIFTQNNSVLPIKYDDGLDDEIERGAIGNISFNNNIELTLADLQDGLNGYNFKENILQFISKIYKPGIRFKDAFKKLLFSLFDEYGLIIFDPQDSAVKKLLIPIFEKEIINYQHHTTTNVLCSAELEEFYHTEVKVNPINIYYSDQTGRHLIEPAENGFGFRGKRKKTVQEDLLHMLHTNPEMFSAGELLLPVCQSFLFPVSVILGNESDINCFAQVIPNYHFFNVVQPMVFPRSSATIIEADMLSVMKRYNLGLQSFTLDGKNLTEKIIKQISEFNVEEMFSTTELKIKEQLNLLTNNLLAVDTVLIDTIEKTLSTIDNALLALKEKTQNIETQKHQKIIAQLQSIKQIIFPNNGLQENELNFISFAGKYGLDIIKWIITELKTNLIEHQILEI